MIQKISYFLINETTVDLDIAMKKREILRENVTEVNGHKLFTITFKQCLQSFGDRNWNQRIYTKDIVMKGLNTNPLIQHDMKMKTWTGEYGHPIIEKGMNELSRQMTIFPPNACWTIDKYWEEGNLLMGECTTLAGGYGDLVRDRVLTNYPAMASSRAIGGVDREGKVLPGYTPITFDCVIRPSHKQAYMVKDSDKLNEFPIHTGQKNTMSESAVMIDPATNVSFKDFLLSESSTKYQIEALCGAFNIDADSMVISENTIKFTTMTEGTIRTIGIPLHQMINAEYYNLF